MRATTRLLKTAIIATAVAISTIPVANAAEPKREGTYKDWTVYSRTAQGDKSCYALSKAKSKSPSSVKHGDIYFMVSNWRSGAATEQPSFLVSYNLNKNFPTSAKIGSKTIGFFTADNEAFIENESDERRLVKAMKAGSTMSFKTQSTRGTRVTYSFSLSGVTAALKKAKAICR